MRAKQRRTINRRDVSEIKAPPTSALRLKLLQDLTQTIVKDFQALNLASETETDFDLAQGFDFYDEVRRFEIQLIIYALNQTNGHQRQAARLLGLKASTFNAKLKLYHIAPRNPVAALPPPPVDLAKSSHRRLAHER